VAIVSCDEKPGIQAIATTAPDLSPQPGLHATFTRYHEYKRNGTVSLLAGIDLVTGKVHAEAPPSARTDQGLWPLARNAPGVARRVRACLQMGPQRKFVDRVDDICFGVVIDRARGKRVE